MCTPDPGRHVCRQAYVVDQVTGTQDRESTPQTGGIVRTGNSRVDLFAPYDFPTSATRFGFRPPAWLKYRLVGWSARFSYQVVPCLPACLRGSALSVASMTLVINSQNRTYLPDFRLAHMLSDLLLHV